MPARILQTDESRVFSIANKAGPFNPPTYQGYWMAGALTWRQGDIKTVRYPSESQYTKFRNAGKIRGEPGYPELPITAKYTVDLSDLLLLVRRGCEMDIQVHFGLCETPNDYLRGWDKMSILEGAVPTQYGTDALGTLEPTGRAQVQETVPLTGDDFYEIKRMIYASQAPSQATQEIVDIVVCDVVTCGLCGITSDGCQVLFAITKAHGGSPGLPAKVLYTQTGGQSWSSVYDTALPVNKDPSAMECIGLNLIVVSAEDGSITYAPTADIIAGAATWTRMATGVVVSGEPRAVFSAGPTLTWFAGNGGYLYFTADPTSSLTVQDAGVASTSQFNAIHGSDGDNIVAVGNTNAVVYTQNGGNTWAPITGPNVGVNLNTVFMRNPYEWWVGDSTGKLWVTTNQGATWHQKTFPKQTLGQVRDIVFTTPSVGYLTVDDGTKAYMLRSYDGGYDWVIVPEGTSALPTFKNANKLAVCADPNVVFAGGLATGGLTGFILKGA